jgi:hypothetical protein
LAPLKSRLTLNYFLPDSADLPWNSFGALNHHTNNISFGEDVDFEEKRRLDLASLSVTELFGFVNQEGGQPKFAGFLDTSSVLLQSALSTLQQTSHDSQSAQPVKRKGQDGDLYVLFGAVAGSRRISMALLHQVQCRERLVVDIERT